MTAQSAWFSEFAPYAEQVHAATGVLTGVVLAVMALETGYGTSRLARENNLSGIRYVGQPQAAGNDGGFATYASPDAWAQDMIRVMQLPYYTGVRTAQTASAQIRALATSGYDAGSLAEQQAYGNTLLEIYAEQGLAAYDGGGITPAPAPAYTPEQFGVAAQGSTLTVTAPAPVEGAGAGFGLALALAVALWVAKHA